MFDTGSSVASGGVEGCTVSGVCGVGGAGCSVWPHAIKPRLKRKTKKPRTMSPAFLKGDGCPSIMEYPFEEKSCGGQLSVVSGQFSVLSRQSSITSYHSPVNSRPFGKRVLLRTDD